MVKKKKILNGNGSANGKRDKEFPEQATPVKNKRGNEFLAALLTLDTVNQVLENRKNKKNKGRKNTSINKTKDSITLFGFSNNVLITSLSQTKTLLIG